MPPDPGFITSTHRTPRRRTVTALGLAVASTAAPVFAQQVSEPLELPALRVEASDLGYKAEEASSPKLSQPLLDTPRSVTVVPQEVMEERGATTLQDVFRNVSGISLAAGEGGAPMGDNLTLRGFSARTDIFVDGMRDFGTYARDPFNLESVEVIKGPASAYAGRGATGGAINLVTKSPKQDDFTSLDLSLGTDQTKRVTADVNRNIDGLEGAALRLNLMAHDSEVAGRDEVKNERWGIAPSFSLGLGTPTRLTLSGLFLKQDNLPDYGHPYLDGRPVPVDRKNWYGLRDFDKDKSTAAQASLRLEHDLRSGLSLRNQLSYGRTTHDSIATAARNPDPVTDTVERHFKNRDSKDTIVNNQTDLIAGFKIGGLKHTLVTGVELAREESSNHGRSIVSTMPDASLSNPNPGDPFSGTVSPSAHTDTTAKSVALYMFDTVELNEQWEFSGGLRWDRFEVDYSSRDVPTGIVTDLDRTDSMFSWNLGAVYKPRPNGSVYVAYGTSFNPSAEGLSLASRGTSLADVKPEKSRTVELGTKWDLLDRRLGLTAAIFRTDKTNARTNGDISLGEPPFVLEGEQRVDGIELGVTGRISDRWQVLTGYTYLDSEIRKSNTADEVGRNMPNVPEHTFNLWTTYQLMPTFEVGAGAQYVASRYGSVRGAVPNEVPDYWMFDAMASYRVHDNVQLRLNLYNLTDEDYYGSVYGGHAVPGAGRSALLTTSFQF